MRLPDGTGLDLLRWLEESGRREKAIVITAYGSAENAVEALKAGAYDYLTKPVDLKQFRGVVASALGRGGAGAPTVDPTSLPSEHRRAGADAARAAAGRRRRRRAPVSQALGRMAGKSTAMQQVRSLVEKVARSMAPVLVHGESGTGKELVARAIHEVSARGAQPFIAVNCSAIPEQLLEAEFFGYRKGAFTGANDDREGFFQAAQRRHAVPRRDRRPAAVDAEQAAARDPGALGAAGRRGGRSSRSTCASLSATHKDLGAEVHAGRFRQDLYYRLNVIQIRVPPLRERLEDLLRDLRARCSSASRATPASRRRRALTRDALVAPGALCLSRQCARAREPAASRGGAVRRRGASTSTTSDCRSRCSPTAAAQELDRLPQPRRAAAEPAALAAAAAGRGAAAERPGRATSTRSSATSWCARSSAIASTAPRPARASACRCARCAIAWRGWASTSAATWPEPSASEARMSARAARRRWRGGWLAAARRRRVAELRRRGRTARRSTLVVIHSISLPPGEYGGDAIERLFTNRLDWDAHPYFEQIRGADGVGALPDPARRRAAAVRVVRRARVACRRVELARARRLQRLSRSASSSKASKARPSRPRSTSASRALLRALARALSDRRAWPGHEHVAPGRKHDPGRRASTGRALRRSAAAPSSRSRTVAALPRPCERCRSVVGDHRRDRRYGFSTLSVVLDGAPRPQI